MPKITQYVAPTKAGVESTRGVSAFEQAGRRLGPLYNEAATFEKEEGKNAIEEGKYAAEAIKEKAWPFDIGELYDKKPTGGFNLKTTGGGDDWNALRNGGRTPVYGDDAQAATQQISRGAAALGTSLSDGGYALATRTPAANVQTLVMGQLVNVDDASKTAAAINSATSANNAANLDPTTQMDNYWTKYNGGNPYATDQSQVSTQGPQTDFGGGGVAFPNSPSGGSTPGDLTQQGIDPTAASTAASADTSNSWTSLIPAAPANGSGNVVSDFTAATTAAPDTGGM